MPKKAREHKGRLEIRNIGVHEGGLYICKATHYENEKGGQAIANVIVHVITNDINRHKQENVYITQTLARVHDQSQLDHLHRLECHTSNE